MNNIHQTKICHPSAWGGLIVLMLLSGSGEARGVQSTPATTMDRDAEAVDSEPTARGFDDGSMKRLGVLREWLNRRNLERKQGIGSASESLGALSALDSTDHPRKLDFDYRRRMLREYEEWEGQRLRTLRIGRGPDGRIYHRYILRSTGTEVTDLSNLRNETKNVDHSELSTLLPPTRNKISEVTRGPFGVTRMVKAPRIKVETTKSNKRRKG
jgi:hypothetical protein